MTMLDDDRLASLFAQAGAAFDAPKRGAADILDRAAGTSAATGVTAQDDVAPPGAAGEVDRSQGAGALRRLNRTARQHRVLSVAAFVLVVIVVAGSIGALARSTTKAPVTSSLAGPARAVPPLRAATTTVPPRASNGTHSPTAQSKGVLGAPAPSFGIAGGATSAGPSSGSGSTPASTTPSLPSGAVGQSAKIEQTGTLGLMVGRSSLGKTMTQLTNLAGAFGGFVASSQTQSGAGGTPYGSVTLQVPVDNFAAVLKQAQRLGKTADLTTKATDVTGQYVDLQSRIAALQASRQQYLTILAKATTIGDVLAVQSQLDSIQSQTEQLQGQLQVLTSETAFSTLNVTVNESAPPPRPGPLPESGLVRAWHDSLGGFVVGVEGLIRVAGPLLFALLCLAGLMVGGRALWRRYQRRQL
jgi:hypothetical protein